MGQKDGVWDGCIQASIPHSQEDSKENSSSEWLLKALFSDKAQIHAVYT